MTETSPCSNVKNAMTKMDSVLESEGIFIKLCQKHSSSLRSTYRYLLMQIYTSTLKKLAKHYVQQFSFSWVIMNLFKYWPFPGTLIFFSKYTIFSNFSQLVRTLIFIQHWQTNVAKMSFSCLLFHIFINQHNQHAPSKK